jgi:hypothetical protein
MVQATLFLLALLSASARSFPLQKRIAQVISDSTTQWEAACVSFQKKKKKIFLKFLPHAISQNAAGGGQQCNPTAVAAFSTLLAGAGVCDQQNNADTMIDLAHQLNSDPNMIKFTQIFAQQPRNSVRLASPLVRKWRISPPLL